MQLPKRLNERILVLLTIAVIGPAQAQMFKDGHLESLYRADRLVEVEKLGAQRLAAQADDPQAVLALAIGALRGNDAGRRKAAIGHAETCLQKQPKAAPCHYALGVVLGVQAMSEGLLKMAGSASRVRESLAEALALEPAWFPARSAVVEFYLLAPGVIGGSTAKAQDTARAAAQPEQVRALEGRLALQDKQFERALQWFAEVRPGGDAALDEDLLAWTQGAAFGLLNEGQGQKARPTFERLRKERPDDAMPLFGLARLEADAGRHAEALPMFERCARLKGADRLPLDYRSGISLQALGQKDAARAAFGRFVKAGKGSSTALDDAKKRLAQLDG
jgi:tetratricopeptide (TPR) repeat protein